MLRAPRQHAVCGVCLMLWTIYGVMPTRQNLFLLVRVCSLPWNSKNAFVSVSNEIHIYSVYSHSENTVCAFVAGNIVRSIASKMDHFGLFFLTLETLFGSYEYLHNAKMYSQKDEEMTIMMPWVACLSYSLLSLTVEQTIRAFITT